MTCIKCACNRCGKVVDNCGELKFSFPVKGWKYPCSFDAVHFDLKSDGFNICRKCFVEAVKDAK